MIAVGRHRAPREGLEGHRPLAFRPVGQLAVVPERAAKALPRGGIPAVAAQVVADRQPAEGGTRPQGPAGPPEGVTRVAVPDAREEMLNAFPAARGVARVARELPQEPVAGRVADRERSHR
jgi:hypothetical protein